MKVFKAFVFIFFVMATSISCQKKTCVDFKIGLFESPDSTISDIKITRTLSEQIEVSKARGFKDTYTIIWKNDCEYQLVLKESNQPEKNLLNKLDTLKVAITEIEGDIYRYTAVLNGKIFEGDLKQTSIKVN